MQKYSQGRPRTSSPSSKKIPIELKFQLNWFDLIWFNFSGITLNGRSENGRKKFSVSQLFIELKREKQINVMHVINAGKECDIGHWST